MKSLTTDSMAHALKQAGPGSVLNEEVKGTCLYEYILNLVVSIYVCIY